MVDPHNTEMKGNSKEQHDGRPDSAHEEEVEKAEHCSHESKE